MVTIDINSIKDDLSGPWWHLVSATDFHFLETINTTGSGQAVVEGDVLVHKQVLPGEQYPSIRYHVVGQGGSTRLATNQEVKELLGKSLLAFIEKTNHLPPNCKFSKRFKNGSVQIDFEPHKNVKFALKIVPADSKVADLDARIETMPSGPVALAQTAPVKGQAADASAEAGGAATMVPAKQAAAKDDLAIPKHIAKIQDSLALIDGIVEAVEKRTSTFQDNVVTYYMLTIRDAIVGLGEKDPIGYPVSVIKARLSENKMLRKKIQPGMYLSMRGKFEPHGNDGFAIKYARGVTTRKTKKKNVSIASPEMVSALLKRTDKVVQAPAWNSRGGVHGYYRDHEDDYYDENDDYYDDDDEIGDYRGGYGPRRSYPPWWNRPVDRAASIHDVSGTPLEAVFGHMDQKVRRKITRAINMLRSQRNMLFIKSEKTAVHGIVRSQSHAGTEYATCIGEGGKYYCVSNTLSPCLGLQGTICKHVLLTIIAAAKDGKVDRAALTAWIQAALSQWPRLDETEAVSIFTEYKSGPLEIGMDWRQVEVLPEDFVAF
ncbi:MAG: hypothetical protein Q6373_017315 [Candidatus Sigynarchaeota archaeon]